MHAETTSENLMRQRRGGASRPRPALLAYAPVGQSGDFSKRVNDDDMLTNKGAKTWTVACGLGWLYGLGCCVGPFYGVGIGLTFPGGVLAGAGGGVGLVFGVGMGSGLVWGAGRGDVSGIGIAPPMQPPFAQGLPRPSDLARSLSLPRPGDAARRLFDAAERMRAESTARVGERLRSPTRQPSPTPRPPAWQRQRTSRSTKAAAG